MGGGLMQLVAYGAQDIYLTGNPQITFFKVVYRRHTNFSMEDIAQDASGTAEFGGEATYTIARNGDLVHKMYFEITPEVFTPLFGTDDHLAVACISSNLGNTLLKEIELEIGGQKIDTHYSHWLTTWNNLTESNPQGLIGTYENDGEPLAHAGGGLKHNSSRNGYLSFNHQAPDSSHSLAIFGMNPISAFVPLQFWFNRNPGLALPLIALQYHEVKIKTKFEVPDALVTALETFRIGANTIMKHSLNNYIKFYVQYIYLDTDERRRFAQVSHEYLIEQLQFQKESSPKTMVELNFNHPVKELIWIGEPLQTPGDSINVTDTHTTTITIQGGKGPAFPLTLLNNTSVENKWQLKLNGHDRFEERNIHYFTRQQIYDHHTGYGGIGRGGEDSIAVYSFALKPEEHQPSGTCNFSRIDIAQLVKTSGNGESIYIYAINYNVLRIMSGMGGLAYSN